MKKSIPMNNKTNLASVHGSFLNQSKRPVAPLLRPYVSNTANILKAVINDGTITMNVKTTCSPFQKASIPGSTSWW